MGDFRRSNIDGQVVTAFTVDNLSITTAKLAAGAVTPAKQSLDIRNESGGALSAGDLIYISGWSETQSRHLVTKADADAQGGRATFVMQGSLANNTNGTAYKTYRLTSVDTSGASVGDPVYLHTTAGGWTLSAPTGADDINQIVGRVAVVNASTGEIEFDLLSNNTVLLGTNEIADLGVTTAKLAANAVTQAKVAANALDGTVVGNVADDNTEGGIPVLHRIDITAGALGDTDVTLTHKTRVVDAWFVLTGSGVASTTFQVKNGANAITDAMDASGSDKAIVRAAEIDDAQHEIAASGTLRVTSASGATQPNATVYVLGIRVA